MSTRLTGAEDEADRDAVPREPTATGRCGVACAARARPGLLPTRIARPLSGRGAALRRIRNDNRLAPRNAVGCPAARGNEALARAAGCEDHVPWPSSPCAPLAKAHQYLPIGKSSCAAHR
jgi:hypothetical protein